MGVLRLSQAGILTGGKLANFLAGLPGPFRSGYWAGGVFGNSTITKLSFVDDTRAALATGLSIGRDRMAGIANARVAGYLAGGIDISDSFRSTIEKVLFASDSVSTLGTGLSSNRAQFCGFGNSGVAGYFAGGNTNSSGASAATTVNKLAFPGDTGSTLGTGLSSARSYNAGFSNSGVAGYSAGGYLPNDTTTSGVDKFAFSDDTRTTLGTGLSSARWNGAGFADSGVAGYHLGGNVTFATSTVDKFAFPSDTRTTLGTGLSANKQNITGMANSGTAGYTTSGSSGGPNKFAFPSDTRSVLTGSSGSVMPSSMANEDI